MNSDFQKALEAAQAANGASAGPSPIVYVIYLAVMVLAIAGMWKVFTKAGKPGWAAIVPIYNLVVLLDIAKKPTWWIIVMLLVPIVNIIFIILTFGAVAEKFGKGAGFGVGMALLGPIFLPILGFGGAQFQGQLAPAVAA